MVTSSHFDQHVWKRWSTDSLEQLATTQQMAQQASDLQPSMLVLLRENYLPSMFCKLAIISETFPGPDGRERVVRVKTIWTILATFSEINNVACPIWKS